MKAMKSYFLFFAPHPILYNFIAWIVAMAVLTLFNAISGHLDSQLDSVSSTFGANSPMADAQFWVTTLLLVVNIFLIYIVIGRNVVRPESVWENYNYFCRAALYPDGHFVIVEKPIWAQAQAQAINVREISNYNTDCNSFICETSCGGQYRNSHITIPVTLTFKLNGPLDKREVFASLRQESLERNQKQFEILDMDDYIRSIFKMMNLKNQLLIDSSIQSYAEQLISKPVLLDHVVEELIFPERLFSNVIDVKICLGEPTHSSCKWMSCGS